MDPDETYDLIMRFREAGATSVAVGSVSVHWPAAPQGRDAEGPVKRETPKVVSLGDMAREQGIGPPTFPTRTE